MRGSTKEEPKTAVGGLEVAPAAKAVEPSVELEPVAVVAGQDPSQAFASSMGVSEQIEQIAKEKAEKEELAAQVDAAMKAAEEAKKKKAASASEAAPSFDVQKYMKKMTSFLARNFFQIKFFALVIAFLINFMLLFYKVSTIESDEEEVEDDGMGDVDAELAADAADDAGDGGEDSGGDEEDGDEESPEEYIHVEQEFWYLERCIKILGMIHCLFSLCMLIAYYNLKIPLAIFKREKQISRKMEFDGIYISEQPEDDDLNGHWDKMVISAKSFPVNYWDKFVKKRYDALQYLSAYIAILCRVREKYSETFEFDALSEILGMDKSAIPAEESSETGLLATLKAVDWRYQVWQIGVTVTDSVSIF